MSNAVATLNGTVNPNGLTTTAWFEWGTSTFDYSQQTTPVAVGNGSAPLPLNSYLTGLMPGVMYRGRMAASIITRRACARSIGSRCATRTFAG